MSYDLPEQPKPWENKRSAVFKKWLKEQICRDPKDWDQDFKTYIAQKEEDSQRKDIYVKPTPEERAEKTFNRYLDGLDLKPEDLQGKSILDVGCENGDFVISCLEKGITQQGYGTDQELAGAARNLRYRNNFFHRDFTDSLPVNKLDYVVSVGAISSYLDEENEINAEEAIKGALRAIKKTGEVRIWPIKKFLRGSDMDGIKEQELVLARIMENLEKRMEIEWELKPTDIQVSGHDFDLWAVQVLIIKRKK